MKTFTFALSSFPLRFVIDEYNNIRLYDDFDETTLLPNQVGAIKNLSYLVDVSLNTRTQELPSSDRHMFSGEAFSLKYVNHKIDKIGNINRLTIVQNNDAIEVSSVYEEYVDAHVLRSYTIIKNISHKSWTIEYVSSFTKYDFTRRDAYNEIDLAICRNAWFLECQWKKQSLSDWGLASPQEIKTNAKLLFNNTGAYSSKDYIPTGLLIDNKIKQYTLWQVENNGSWFFELGDFIKSTQIAISGPSFQENNWQKTLKPQEEFISVKCALTRATSEQEVFNNMTIYRRHLLNKNNDHLTCPVIFNNYMQADLNAPSEDSIRQYAPIVKEVGGEYFVIDCGWHDDEENPFNYVGKWEESKRKFPQGLSKTLDYLRSLNLKVGLWLEFEVVGYLGDAHLLYDEDCYFKHNNEVAVFVNRYQLDFRNPKVYKKIWDKVCSVVDVYQLDYLKIDYNIEPGNGTSLNAESYGESLLEHNRALNRFMLALGEKYPNLVIESCASGGNRLDYVSLASSNLVSISDQDDYMLYPYICANVLSNILPEQAGLWAVPMKLINGDINPSEDEMVLCMLNAFIGRMHLGSKINLLNANNKAILKEAISVYKKISLNKNRALPYFPLGLANINDKTLAFGYQIDNTIYLLAYHLKSMEPLIVKQENIQKAEVIFPSCNNCSINFDDKKLIIVPERIKTARLIKITLNKGGNGVDENK